MWLWSLSRADEGNQSNAAVSRLTSMIEPMLIVFVASFSELLQFIVQLRPAELSVLSDNRDMTLVSFEGR